MPRRKRPAETTRSEHWLREAVNRAPEYLNAKIRDRFGWSSVESLIWRSPIKDDEYAEYYDQAFLDRLGLRALRVPLKDFWPPGGPRWDGLATTDNGKILLVEAKAYIEEAVDFGSRASSKSLNHIVRSLDQARRAFKAPKDAPWQSPFYQYANRLAHLYFLRTLNDADAYLLFLYFADAPDVPDPCTTEQWEGAIRVTKKVLGLGAHPYQNRVRELVLEVRNLRSP